MWTATGRAGLTAVDCPGRKLKAVPDAPDWLKRQD
jgi:hypothetical protein